jgi:hypothetical protein
MSTQYPATAGTTTYSKYCASTPDANCHANADTYAHAYASAYTHTHTYDPLREHRAWLFHKLPCGMDEGSCNK